jgi:4-hydroxy-tetrahydrodipicolinate reductase
MGRTVLRAIAQTPGLVLAAALERQGSEHVGADAAQAAGLPPCGVPITVDALEAVAHTDAIVDFTAPESSVALADLAAQARIVHVIGSTGFAADDERRLRAAARHATLIKSGNMSLGVNLLAGLVAQAAKALGPEFDVEIVEMHHRHKIDAPSGTAKLLGEAAAGGRGVSLEAAARWSREGLTGPRREGEIGFAVLRGGGVVGDHTVMFAGADERIELTHRAADRGVFARGALTAARWGHGKGPGLFSMRHVLGLEPV